MEEGEWEMVTAEIKPVQSVKQFKRETFFKYFKKNWHLYAMLVIPISFYIIFKYIPMYGNIIAFRKYIPGGSVFGAEWVGLIYFAMFIFDPTFWHVFKNTLILSFYSLLFDFPSSIIFALLLNELRHIVFKKVVQTISYLPHFITLVVVVGMISEILSPSYGVINSILQALGFEPIYFLTKPEWFRTIYITSQIWQGLGWGAIIYLAALAGIDPHLYEAAEVDGANRWKQMWHISLSGIMPVIMILLILNIGNFLSVGFQKILLLANPLTYETADVIQTYVYRMGFENYNYSFATAIGLFDAVIGLFLVVMANQLARKYSETSLW
jgi:putative aldouronate transport system permease protein